MDPMMLRSMFCTKCSLQFNKPIVYDLHLSLVHGKKINIKQEPNSCEISSEDTETFIENNCADKPFECKICDSEFAYSSVPNRRACTFINFEKKNYPLYGLIWICTVY